MSIDVPSLIGAVNREVRDVEREGRTARVVVASRTYDTSVEDLWDAITTAERIPRWFLPIEGDLRGPDLHLHSYLEDWIDLLFSWVKYFFVGDLWWRRFEEMQGYEDYREVLSHVQNTMGTERAEQATFDAILATFTQHAEHWSGKVAAGGSR